VRSLLQVWEGNLVHLEIIRGGKSTGKKEKKKKRSNNDWVVRTLLDLFAKRKKGDSTDHQAEENRVIMD